jgi:hypothetical protein
LYLLDLLDQHGRQRVDPSGGAHQHRLRHRQGQRQVKREDSPAARGRRDLDAPAQAGDRVLDHIHPDPASGYLRDFLGSREARVNIASMSCACVGVAFASSIPAATAFARIAPAAARSRRRPSSAQSRCLPGAP